MVARRRTGSKIKILVLHNRAGRGGLGARAGAAPLEAGPESDTETESAHLRALADGLTKSGFEVALVDAEDDTRRIAHALVVEQPGLVFLVDHFRGETLRHPSIASFLELHGLPFTGSDPLCLSTCQDRVRTHLLLSDAEVPVPPYAVIRDINAIPDTDALGSPLLISHAFDDVYDDVERRALATSRAEVEDRARILAAEVGLPLLIERLVEGRRIQAVVLGNRVLEVLPLSERVADAGGRLGPATIAQLDMDTADAVRALAQRAFRVMGCRDGAQVDFAVDRDGRAHAIDVRPVFDMFPHSPFMAAASVSELGVSGAVAHLAAIALERAELEAGSRPMETAEPVAAPDVEQPPEPEPAAPPPEPETPAPPARRPRPPSPRRQPAATTPAPRPPRPKKPRKKKKET